MNSTEESNHKELYNCLRNFSINAFEMLSKKLMDEVISIPKGYYQLEADPGTFIFRHRKEIYKLPEVKECFNAFRRFPDFHKKFGFIPENGRVPSVKTLKSISEEILRIFLGSLAIKTNLKFDQKSFDEVYLKYEERLLSDKNKFQVFTPLHNFKCEESEVDLGNGLKMRTILEEERNRIRGGFLGPIGPLSPFEIDQLENVLETVSEFELGEALNLSNIDSVFDKAVTALRLFQKGVVYRVVTYRRSLMVHPMGFSAGWSETYKPSGPRYLLKEGQIEAFKNFWNKFKELDLTKRAFLDVAIRRFNHAYEMKRHEDKLIDFMISFEALCFRGEKGLSSQIGKAIAIAISMLIGRNDVEREEIRNFLDEAYELRNKIVHGSKIEDKISIKGVDSQFQIFEFSSIIEEYLRLSIKKLL